MADEWYFMAHDDQYGPIPFADLLEMSRSGQLAEDDSVRQGADGEWVSADSIAELLPHLAPADSAASNTSPDDSDDSDDSDEWYGRVLGSEIGPMSFDNLKLIARRGELSEDDEVRRGADGPWVVANTIENLFHAAPEVATELSELMELTNDLAGHRGVRTAADEFEPATASVGAQWYCSLLGTELGPMSFDDLKLMALHGELSMDDLVKRSRQGEWMAARTIEGLVSAIAAYDPDQLTSARFDKEQPQVRETIAATADADDFELSATSAATDFTTDADDFELDDSVNALVTESVPDAAGVESATNSEQPAADQTVDRNAIEPPVTGDQAQEKIDDGWYLRMHGVEHGPIAFDELKHLAAKKRVTAESEVKHGRNGAWVEAGSVLDLSTLSSSARDVSTASVQSSPSVPRSVGGTFQKAGANVVRKQGRPVRAEAEPAIDRRQLYCVVGALVVVGLVVAIVKYVPFGPTDKDDLQYLNAVWKEFQRHKQNPTTQAEWSSFYDRVKAESEPMQKRLKETAGSTEPAKQHLLWAVQDYLLPMIAEARQLGAGQQPTDNEKLFANDLEQARMFLEGTTDPEALERDIRD